MTTPTTTSPGIHQLPEPCWTVLLDGDPDSAATEDRGHFETREAAEKVTADYNTPGHPPARLVQVPDLCCWYAVTLCGQRFIYHGDEEEQHFTDEDTILTCASLQDNVLVTDGVLTCDEDCETCGPERRRIKQELSIRDTHPDVFTRGLAEGWADPITDPTEIDWSARRATMFGVMVLKDGRPVNPWGPNLKYGRGELGHWGEKANADAVVFCRVGARRYILLGERDDGHGWALPGGGLEIGEDIITGALRELEEETGLRVTKQFPNITVEQHSVRYVRDPRASRESWMVTAPVVIDLGELPELPELTCTSDLVRAMWFQCDTTYRVIDRIAELGGKVFESHEQMLTNAIHGALS